jgi:hypothetical protein
MLAETRSSVSCVPAAAAFIPPQRSRRRNASVTTTLRGSDSSRTNRWLSAGFAPGHPLRRATRLRALNRAGAGAAVPAALLGGVLAVQRLAESSFRILAWGGRTFFLRLICHVATSFVVGVGDRGGAPGLLLRAYRGSGLMVCRGLRGRRVVG